LHSVYLIFVILSRKRLAFLQKKEYNILWNQKERSFSRMKANFSVLGMSCSACSAAVEKAVRRIEGVTEASVNLLACRMVCVFDAPASIDKIIAAVEKAGFCASLVDDKKKRNDVPQKDTSPSPKVRLIVSITALILLMYLSMGHMISLPFTDHFFQAPSVLGFVFTQFLLTLVIVFVNRNFFQKGIPALLHGASNMDTLVSIGAGAALLYGIVSLYLIGYHLGHGNPMRAIEHAHNLYFESAGMILTLVTVGKTLEERAKGKTDRALKALMDLSPKSALVIRSGREMTVSAADIQIGDLVRIRPGERLAVDGIVEEGTSSLDTSAITGESVPYDCKKGDKVLSGSMNLQGTLLVCATEVGAKTTLAQIIALVEEATSTKAPVSRLADRISGIFVPIVLSISAITAILWLIAGYGISFAFQCAVSVLVVSCPCALGLATPVAMTVAMGKSAQNGILVKSATALETLHEVDTILLDKTGTITKGTPSVTDYYTTMNQEAFLRLAASLEAQSEHPLARAVVAHYQGELLTVSDFSAVFGRGISATIDGIRYYAGNQAYLQEVGIATDTVDEHANAFLSDGKTVLYFACAKECLGIIAVSDPIKESSYQAISDLQHLGLKIQMLTGDHPRAAAAIQKELGLSQVYAQILPQQKEAIVSDLQAHGHKVAMVGDGINDSPALVRADVGIAIGAGSDIAIDSADLVLMKSDLCDVARAIRFSRQVLRNIRQNLFWAFFYNTLGIPIAAGVLYLPFSLLLHPMIAAAAMSCSSLFVVTNALRLTRSHAFENKEDSQNGKDHTN
jgi:Cu+-exporting ATPase